MCICVCLRIIYCLCGKTTLLRGIVGEASVTVMCVCMYVCIICHGNVCVCVCLRIIYGLCGKTMFLRGIVGEASVTVICVCVYVCMCNMSR